MPSNLQPIGLLSYNGIPFSQYAYTLAFTQKPVPDESGRTIKYIEYDLTVKDLIIGSPTDARVQTVRTALLKWGARLLFVNRGMGNLNINTGGTFDVEWGPKPQEISFKYLGAQQACEVVWRVTWKVPDCAGAAFAGQLMEFNYKLDVDKDRAGFTTRTYSGYLQIPHTRYAGPDDRRLLDSADNYLERITPPFLVGFRRIPGKATINYAKTRCDFSIVDEEIPSDNYLPPGIVEATAEYSHASQSPGLVQWGASLRATYTVAKGYDRGIVVDEFTKLIAEKWALARKRLPADKGTSMVFTSFGASEPDIYGPPRATLFATWTYAAFIDEFFGASGLWVRLETSDWFKWAYSMKDTLGTRARAGLIFNVGEDRLLDLCSPVPAIPGSFGKRTKRETDIPDVLVTPCPSPPASWVKYDVHIDVEKDSGGMAHRKLPQTPPVAQPPSGPPPLTDTNPPNLGIPFNGSGGRLDSVFQQRTGEMVYVYLIGEALRVCYPVPEPRLETINGFEPKADNRLDKGEGFKQGLLTNVGHPLYYGNWRLRYLVPKTYLQKLPIQGNPFYQGP